MPPDGHPRRMNAPAADPHLSQRSGPTHERLRTRELALRRWVRAVPPEPDTRAERVAAPIMLGLELSQPARGPAVRAPAEPRPHVVHRVGVQASGEELREPVAGQEIDR